MKKFLPYLIFLIVGVFFFYKTFFFFQIPFPGDLLISEYAPWKYESFLGYNPSSYPNKAQYFDVIRQLYPWKMLAIDQWKSGQVPLWNPYNFSGSPLLANNQSGVFYPINVLFFVLPKTISWTLYIFLQPVLASFFTFIFLRSLKRSVEGSIISSIAFGFSLYMSTFLEYGNIGHTILWLPLLLFLIQKVDVTRKIKYFFLLSFVIPVVFFAGHLQIAFGVVLFSLLYALFVIGRKKKSKDVLTIFIFFFLGFTLSSIQLIPTYELITNSARVAHESKTISELFLLQFQQLVVLISPDAYGNPATRNYTLTDTYPGNALYVGIIPLLFAILSVLSFKKNDSIFKFFVISTGLLLVTFISNPISQFIFTQPIFASSSPSNFFFLLSFCIVVLCAYGFDQTSKFNFKSLYPVALVSLFLIVLVAINILLNQPIMEKQIVLGSIFLLASTFGFFMYLRFRKKWVWLIPFLILVVDLFFYFQKFNPFVPASLLYPPTKVEMFLKDGGNWRFIGHDSASINSNFSTIFRTYSPEGYDPLYPKSYAQFFSDSKRSDVTVGMTDPSILNELGVRHVLDRIENGSTEKTFSKNYQPIVKENGWIIYENMTVLPRAYVNSNRVIIPVEIAHYSPNKVVINFNRATRGELILSDVWYPGWEVKIDGKSQKIEKYHNVFRLVKMKSGDKTAVFEYKPLSFSWGVVVSIISTVTLIGGYYFVRKRNI